MSRGAPQQREARLEDHRAAVREFVERASALDAVEWLTPRAEGKWTPAQEARHLILTYEALTRDLTGGAQLRLRGNPWKRRVWRWIGLTSILWRKRIPVAVRAPREVRPEWEPASANELLPLLRARADEFDAVYVHACEAEPSRCLSHPMFGALSLDHAIRLMSVHTRHHAAFLPAPVLISHTERI
jgi:hypothetical protein